MFVFLGDVEQFGRSAILILIHGGVLASTMLRRIHVPPSCGTLHEPFLFIGCGRQR